jgi:hypothetical protein
MKTVVRNFFVSAAILITVIACGSNMEVKKVSNEFLGEYPSLLKEFAAKTEKMETEIKQKKESKDLESLMKLAKDKKALENEFKTKVDEYAKSFGFTKAIPFEAAAGSPYTISGTKVKTATSSALQLTMSVTLNQDIKTEYGNLDRILVVYFKAVDKDGKVLPKSYTNASKANIDMKSGSTFDLNLAWNNKVAQNFENFAKLVQVTEAEYNSNK